ncbi:hypothetical protein OBBRIDRAFT_203014 [Obba rivulosa]|uniref:Uncharacterized protein n=1 Tax=Obba rivulosa TaxID=1052685 RepID=A0A8E2AWQ4_9APHY|nr:hypothetical protein OBBRIDRAFT_203014 [Obba rivulosa]
MCSGGITIFKALYPTVASQLKRDVDIERLTRVEELYRSQLNIDPGTPVIFDSPPPSVVPSMELPFTGAIMSFPDRGSLARALRTIKHSIKDPKTFPSPSALATFIETYKTQSTSAPKILQILWRRASRHRATLSLWALAEMLVYERAGDRPNVLWVYNHHFHIVGVPTRMQQYVRRLRRRARKAGRTSGGQEDFTLPRLPKLKTKLWPTAHHTALVWRTAAASARSREYLELMYKYFLVRVEQSQSAEGSRHLLKPILLRAAVYGHVEDLALDNLHMSDDAEEADYPAPIAPPITFDAAHFNAFMQEFAWRIGPYRAARVLIDMARLNITPNRHTYTILVDTFARYNRRAVVFELLDRMEANPAFRGAVAGAIQPDIHPRHYEWLDLPFYYSDPNIVTYTAALVWFVKGEQYEDAALVVERMYKHIPRVKELMWGYSSSSPGALSERLRLVENESCCAMIQGHFHELHLHARPRSAQVYIAPIAPRHCPSRCQFGLLGTRCSSSGMSYRSWS